MSNLTDSTPGGSNLAGAVEGTGINKGELFSSYDVDAFEVPGGRDELWRFTPLRRLRGLHDGTAVATAAATVAVNAPGDVTAETVERSDDRLGQGGIPSDRVAAQAYSSFSTATVFLSASSKPLPTRSKSASPGLARGRSRTATHRFAPVHCPSRSW
ncbi:FeS assembly protein SufD [Mycobacteroides abscessus]|nr:FeS assembly protein SufD [Mycobacteroides abscessus]